LHKCNNTVIKIQRFFQKCMDKGSLCACLRTVMLVYCWRHNESGFAWRLNFIDFLILQLSLCFETRNTLLFIVQVFFHCSYFFFQGIGDKYSQAHLSKELLRVDEYDYTLLWSFNVFIKLYVRAERLCVVAKKQTFTSVNIGMFSCQNLEWNWSEKINTCSLSERYFHQHLSLKL
jgi:hypothetical protein